MDAHPGCGSWVHTQGADHGCTLWVRIETADTTIGARAFAPAAAPVVTTSHSATAIVTVAG